MNTELARAVDVMMAQAKRIYILMIRVNKLSPFYSSEFFLKEIEDMFSVFLSSYRNTRESLGELEKLDRNMVHVFYSSIKIKKKKIMGNFYHSVPSETLGNNCFCLFKAAISFSKLRSQGL